MAQTTRVDWAAVDWKRSDVVLMAELGVSRHTVYRHRNKPLSGRRIPKPMTRAAVVRAQLSLLREMPSAELWPYTRLAQRLSLGTDFRRPTPKEVFRLLALAGLLDKSSRRLRRVLVDWRLPDSAIALAWRSRVKTVAGVRRHKRLPEALWPARGWHLNPEAMTAFDEQERRAQALAG